ncbi:dipeptidyl aminopeptidase [Pochonia chlamydosporia 170]|uniref:Probable dipeptidyl-aminopeptidase B n=1 Tax=Pochonia chlamydosporia 170 TaxID=1380566 RepID=A0A179FS43_METCM|nr:dipeptidyl aminopeptidase [Pochonia chlamydosporia 170]OAQ67903.1 dipeptidyl aminopeptidase [Pochonia chlamydosporia 170]
MAASIIDDLETQGLSTSRRSQDSLSSVSTTSLVFDRIQEEMDKDPSDRKTGRSDYLAPTKDEGNYEDVSETGAFLGEPGVPLQRKPMDRGFRRVLIIIGAVFVAAWLAGLGVFVLTGSYKHESDSEHNPDANSRGSGKAVTMDQVFSGFWSPRSQSISWIEDPDGDDGLLFEVGTTKGFLIAEDVRTNKAGKDAVSPQTADTKLAKSRILMKDSFFMYKDEIKKPEWYKPSPDLKKVLLAVKYEKNWRHSFKATYFILDVETAKVEPLFPDDANARVQLANWSPKSDAISFTMNNNIYIRRLNQANDVVQITKDGGPEYFYGIPDWVYEEEVLSGRTATWWCEDGKYLAFLRTNETAVPEYAIEYYIQRPTGKKPLKGEEAYPDVRKIKYPKPGAHNPVVDVQYYDVSKGDVFSVPAADEFPDDDRIITNVLWAGNNVLVKQSNRVGDFLKLIHVDPSKREAKIVNSVNVAEIDGGWFEISHTMTYVPADVSKGRQQDGYVDTVIHEGYEHIGYFTPIDNPKPIMLTSGKWEVEDAPSAVDLTNNLVYFVAAKESSIQRHVYSVKLDGSDLTPLTDTTSEGYYTVSFSSKAGFALLTYKGPKIPYQKVISTPSTTAKYSRTIEDNAELADRAKKHELPILKYGTLKLSNGISVNYLERRPPHFNPKKKYPILFQQYSGPISQTVTKKFTVDFQSYVASSLGYLVVTIDPRGTGFLGRQHRVVVRSKIGVLEAEDHIAAAKHYSSLPYVDPSRLAIWGWSYGGFQTLKTLEVDAGQTYSYGMAVAPVTDWRFYDSIYTERYMRLPQDNSAGYEASAITNATALGMNKRFLIMHGSADDNVHFQNSLKLLDTLDLAGVENYDVHVFPDSDHGIGFHGANRLVYDRLNNWLINAFNGEWLKIANPKPIDTKKKRDTSVVMEQRCLEM